MPRSEQIDALYSIVRDVMSRVGTEQKYAEDLVPLSKMPRKMDLSSAERPGSNYFVIALLPFRSVNLRDRYKILLAI